MGQLKDKLIPEDEWSRYELSEPEYNYLKNMYDFIEAQKNYLDGLLHGFMKLQALKLGYDVTDKLMFDVDFEDNREIKIRKIG